MHLNKTNRAELLKLGFDIGERAAGGVTQGAWFATDQDGADIILKWSDDKTMAGRYEALLPGLDELRKRGVPVPAYLKVLPFDGGTLSAQQALPGQSEDNPPQTAIDQMVRYIADQAGISGPPPTTDCLTWGSFVVHSLQVGQDGWAMHEPLRSHSPRSGAVLERIEAVGAKADASAFPDNGLVHLDLHTDNILINEGKVTGIIDWEGACAGDPLYDLVQFAFDLDGHDQPVWNIVDDAALAPQILRAYIALLVLKCTSSAIRHCPDDVTRQLDRAERVFERYGV